MTIHTIFPDAIVFSDGTIRLVTAAAKSWAYTSTTINRWCEINTVPDYVEYDNSIPQLMENKGFVVVRERMPVSHYRSKRRTSLKVKTSSASEDEHDSHRARFYGLTLEEYRKQMRA